MIQQGYPMSLQFSISSQQATDLKGFVHEDFHYIKQMINEQYPNADIDWKSPIKELLYSVK